MLKGGGNTHGCKMVQNRSMQKGEKGEIYLWLHPFVSTKKVFFLPNPL